MSEKLCTEAFWWRQLVIHSAVKYLDLANNLFLIAYMLSFFSDEDKKKSKKKKKKNRK